MLDTILENTPVLSIKTPLRAGPFLWLNCNALFFRQVFIFEPDIPVLPVIFGLLDKPASTAVFKRGQRHARQPGTAVDSRICPGVGHRAEFFRTISPDRRDQQPGSARHYKNPDRIYIPPAGRTSAPSIPATRYNLAIYRD